MRAYASAPAVVVEDHRRKQVAVLGDGNRRHLQLHRLIEHFIDPARAIEQRILGVQMKMERIRELYRSRFYVSPCSVPCSRSVLGAKFAVPGSQCRVRSAMSAVGTPNPEPRTEREHEPSSENHEA
jgi:hypothetical protein